MAEHSAPWNDGDPGGDATLGDWINIFLGVHSPGVLIGVGGELVVSPGGGFSINVATGRATGLGHYYENDAVKNIPLTPNATGSIRYDRVVVRINVPARTMQTVAVVGDNLSPPALAADPTNLVDLPRAVLAVGNGSPNIVNGDIINALDPWASPANGSAEIGTLVPYMGKIASVGKLFVPAFGQVMLRFQYEKLWAVLPDIGSGGASFGRSSAFGTITMPDMRGRTVIGVDNMGQGGAGPNVIDATGDIGNLLGSSRIGVADLAPHHHWLRQHANPFFRTVFGDTGSTVGLVPGATGPNKAALATLDGLYSLFSDQAATEDTPGGPDQNPDSKIPPAMLGYWLLRAA